MGFSKENNEIWDLGLSKLTQETGLVTFIRGKPITGNEEETETKNKS